MVLIALCGKIELADLIGYRSERKRNTRLSSTKEGLLLILLLSAPLLYVTTDFFPGFT